MHEDGKNGDFVKFFLCDAFFSKIIKTVLTYPPPVYGMIRHGFFIFNIFVRVFGNFNSAVFQSFFSRTKIQELAAFVGESFILCIR